MSSAILDHIRVERQLPVATITINRPDRRNAISYQMWGELADRLAELDADRAVRAVVITGAGEVAFSAGADIQDFDRYRADSTKGRVYEHAHNLDDSRLCRRWRL